MTASHRRLVRRLLKHLPRRGNLRRIRLLAPFMPMADRANWLFSYRKGPVVSAIYSGSILSMLPLVGVQLVLAFLACVLLRGNFTVSAGLQLISNPLTVVPLYAGSYATGSWLLGLAGLTPSVKGVDDYLIATCLGGLVFGLFLAVTLHFLLSVLVRARGQISVIPPSGA